MPLLPARPIHRMTPRTNPFRADRLDLLPYFFEGETYNEKAWESLLARLEFFDFRAAIVGPKGRGKSTLMNHFAPRLQERGWNVHRLKLCSAQRNFESEIWSRLETFQKQDFVLLDGAEQLSFWRWKCFLRLTRRTGGLLISSHRAGLLPTLWECRSSSQLLQSLLFQLAPESQNEMQAQMLFEKHRGNLRDALRELYDIHSR